MLTIHGNFNQPIIGCLVYRCLSYIYGGLILTLVVSKFQSKITKNRITINCNEEEFSQKKNKKQRMSNSDSGEVKTEAMATKEKTTARQRKLKENKSESKSKTKPKPLSHPPYFQMIKEAITALNEKGGSSPYAIAKYMEQKHKKVLPTNFRKTLGLQLKNSVSKGKLVKVKASYKLSEAGKKREKRTKAARANAVKAKDQLPKRRKSRILSKIDSPTISPTAAAAANPTGRRSKRTASVNKPKQLKSISKSVKKQA